MLKWLAGQAHSRETSRLRNLMLRRLVLQEDRRAPAGAAAVRVDEGISRQSRMDWETWLRAEYW
jgi:hypothetical protein